jgi:hypothetical protein
LWSVAEDGDGEHDDPEHTDRDVDPVGAAHQCDSGGQMASRSASTNCSGVTLMTTGGFAIT